MKLSKSYIELTLIGLILSSGLVSNIIGLIHVDYKGLMVVTMVLMTILLLFYMFKLHWSVYTLVLATMDYGFIDLLFMMNHWPGAGIIRIVGNIGILIFASLLIRNGFKNNRNKYLLFTIASVLVGTIILDYTMTSANASDILFYPIVAIIGTMKLRNIKTELGMDKVLNVILIQGILYIMTSSLNLLHFN